MPASAALFAGQDAAWAQQPQSPVAAVSPDAKRYPDGNRLHEEYATPNQTLAVPPAASAATRSAVVGLTAAARAQSGLPEGFTVLQAPTRQISTSASIAGPAAAPTTGTADAAPAASDEKLITVHPLAYRGVPLSRGSDYMTVVGGDNRLLVTRRRGLPNSVDGTVPTLTADTALAAARQAAGAAFSGADAQVRPALEVWVDEQQSGHLSWTFALNGGTPTNPDHRTFWVATIGEPRVLHWVSEVYHQHHGVVSGNILTKSSIAGAPTENRTFPDLQVTRSTDSAHVRTSADGRYGYTTGTGNAQITALLQGPFAVIQNQAGPGMQSSQSGGVANPIDLNFGASSETELAQTTAFYWTNFAHELAQSVLGPTSLANLPVKTNINATCNAFWDGSSLNFFHAGGGCPNTAYSDVVMHEFGHGIDAANGGILDGGYSEGFGDSIAVLGTQQPCVGRDFFGAGTCLRPATDVVFWPPPAGDEVHDVGRRYAGFVWELVQQLKHEQSDDEAFRLAKRLVLGAAAANPANIPDAVRLSFVVDAPDGNPAHGSPHFRALAAAADSRHIPRPPDPIAAGTAASASATFPWSAFKAVTANSVILQVAIHLDRPAAVHMIASSSALSTGAITFQTGLYDDPNPNIVWTNSYRNLALPANQWVNFDTTAAINLAAGDHTVYWKIWITGGKLTLSSGTLLLEGFEGVGSTLNVTAEADSAQTVASVNSIASASAAASPKTAMDGSGQAITVTAAGH
jgi:hypothetical protein